MRFQYEVAFSDRLEYHRFVLEMHLNGHEFLIPKWGRNMLTDSSGWLCRWIHLQCRDAAWPWTYGQGTDVSFIRWEKEPDFELRLTRMFLLLRRSVLDRNILQDLILPHVDIFCFNYLFPVAWLLTRREHFRESSDFEHRFRKMAPPLPFHILWNCIEAYFSSGRDRGRFCVSVESPEWLGLETHRVWHVTTLSVFSCYANWMFEGCFWPLVFTSAQSQLAVSTAIQFLRVSSDVEVEVFHVGSRVWLWKSHLVALNPSVILFIDFIVIKGIVGDHAYYLTAAIMA